MGKYKKFCLDNFKEHFGENTLLANIRYVDLETYKNLLKRKLPKDGTIRIQDALRVQARTSPDEMKMIAQAVVDTLERIL